VLKTLFEELVSVLGGAGVDELELSALDDDFDIESLQFIYSVVIL
jgi:hypothetical protein